MRHTNFGAPALRNTQTAPWILSQGGLETSRQKPISLNSQTKKLAVFVIFVGNKNFDFRCKKKLILDF